MSALPFVFATYGTSSALTHHNPDPVLLHKNFHVTSVTLSNILIQKTILEIAEQLGSLPRGHFLMLQVLNLHF